MGMSTCSGSLSTHTSSVTPDVSIRIGLSYTEPSRPSAPRPIASRSFRAASLKSPLNEPSSALAGVSAGTFLPRLMTHANSDEPAVILYGPTSTPGSIAPVASAATTRSFRVSTKWQPHRMTVSRAYVGGYLAFETPVPPPPLTSTLAAFILRRFSLRMMSKTESITICTLVVSVAHVG